MHIPGGIPKPLTLLPHHNVGSTHRVRHGTPGDRASDGCCWPGRLGVSGVPALAVAHFLGDRPQLGGLRVHVIQM